VLRQAKLVVRPLAAAALLAAAAVPAAAAPAVTRLTPPSNLFSSGERHPIVARFLPGQRFDLQATVKPDPGYTVKSVRFFVDNVEVQGGVSVAPATTSNAVGSHVATLRAYSNVVPGEHRLRVVFTQDGPGRPGDNRASAVGNFEIVPLEQGGRPVRNVIFMIGDGMGIAHRTAARIMAKGVSQGKANGLLAMDTFPFTGLVLTHSLNSIVTDSSPGAACYSTGNKSNNNQHGVFPDDTTLNFDNPRVELLPEYLYRLYGRTSGIVTTSDVFDATPGAFGSHTQSRGAGTGIVDQYLDDRGLTGLAVLMGGGRKWFLPNTTPGSARTASTDYADLTSLAPWGAAPGKADPERDLIADFEGAGFYYAPDKAALHAFPAGTRKLLGLFSLSNMNIALDKIEGRRGNAAVVDDYGFPDQPMLDEMTEKAIEVLSQNRRGFTLMVEAASIDKQAHNMDSERWILDTIEFDRAIAVAKRFAERNPDTLVVVTADHECAGVNIIGGSRVTNAVLEGRSAGGTGPGGGTDGAQALCRTSGSTIDPAGLRCGLVGTYESAGFPRYQIAGDGYPVTTDVDFRMLIGYAANADRFEDWLTNPQPLRDSQQPFNGQAPLNTYPTGPLSRDVTGDFLVTGQIADTVAAHTGSDIPLSAFGRGASLFTGVMDNTDVFFKAAQAAIGGAR
jgi:alkaline phosphatase